MSRRNKRDFWESAKLNNATYQQYYKRLLDLAISRFEWVNLPDTIDARFMELILITSGSCLFFRDEFLNNGDFLALRYAAGGDLDFYRNPIRRNAIADNGYHAERSNKNSVIIYNNYLRSSGMNDIECYALRLYNIDRIIDVNVNAQKTPVLISCPETQRLTLLNLYKEYDGNAPVIWGDNKLDVSGISSIQTGAPYVSDRLIDLKYKYWNEALTYLGYANITETKRERMIKDEAQQLAAGALASRNSALQARRDACRQINKMFGLDIDINFRETIENEVTSENVDLYN